MANINLPNRFELKLKQNQGLDGIVKTTLDSFGEILKDNKLYFFGDYTDHGITHIENVIASSDNLITDETFNDILSDKDVGYYTLAVILHDIGMHLNLDGFICLIEGGYNDIRITDLDNLTWKDLWEEYLNEAKKFSGKQLKGIFGNQDAVIELPPFDNPGKINENHKKLIGEFLRRNHARLAHEIAIKGFPGNPKLLEFAKGLDIKDRRLVGLIARSHNMGLRKCLDYIEQFYGKSIRRTPNGIHATYLMVLLRIADYVQIDSSRTSKTLLKLKTFSSPISEIEHGAHLAVDGVDLKYQDDPERVFVSASPKDSSMYLKLRQLIKAIQYEFDISWAVLGELYGGVKERPEIKYRRITSNLEENSFTSSQEYVTDNFSFKANDEIVKLLIAPLYGDDLKYGVRELLQNSVDACKERERIAKVSTEVDFMPVIDMHVTKEGDSHFFSITDNGIGMDVDVIKNYFFNAGASYRTSLQWQKKFVDNTGKSTVRRSGRFGVGVLAAFLIGDKISVETKKEGASTGYKFIADLNSDQINVLKDETIKEGTNWKFRANNTTHSVPSKATNSAA